MLPSYKGGINSEPNFKKTGTVTAKTAINIKTTTLRLLNAQARTFLWHLARKREAKCSSNARGLVLRRNIIIKAGTKVIESTAPKKTENIWVAAIGRKSLPSCPTKLKSGKNPITVTISDENIGAPTSFIASIIT